jgi:hypothetical protein
LFSEPCGTPSAGSPLLNFCIGVCVDLSDKLAASLGLKACFALLKISFALATLLLLLFFSVVTGLGGGGSLVGLRSGLRSATAEVSELFDVAGALAVSSDIGEAMVVSGSALLPLALPELPNILFSKPEPVPEKLRRLLLEEASLRDVILDAAFGGGVALFDFDFCLD